MPSLPRVTKHTNNHLHLTHEQLLVDDLEIRPLNDAEIHILARMVLLYLRRKEGHEKGFSLWEDITSYGITKFG